MKNFDILELVESGVLIMTTVSLNPKDAYSTFILKKQLFDAYNQVREQRQALLKEAGIEEGTDVSKLPKDDERLQKANALLEEMWNADTPLNLRTISFDSWRKLQEENKDNKSLSARAEYILENVFWETPNFDNNEQ